MLTAAALDQALALWQRLGQWLYDRGLLPL